MTGKLSRAITAEMTKHDAFWNSFDKVIVYYDNGQVELTKILSSVFNVLYTDVEFRKVKPVDYKLFQVADLVCTMELLSEKAENRAFSKSETEFFCSIRDFRKNYLKPLQKKKLYSRMFLLRKREIHGFTTPQRFLKNPSFLPIPDMISIQTYACRMGLFLL